MVSREPLSRRRFLQVAAATAASVPIQRTAARGKASAPMFFVRSQTTPADTAWNDQWKRAAEPFSGVTLHVPAGQTGHWGANAEAARVFANLTGIQSKWEDVPYEQQYQKIFLDLNSKSGTYDLIPLNYAWFGGFMSGNHLEPVAKYLNDERFPKVDMSVFIPRLVDVYTMWEGKQYGLPWLGDAMIFPYNTKYFQAAGLDPNKPPQNWDEVIAYGKRLTSRNKYGFALMGGRQIQAMCTYAAILFAHDTQFYDNSGRPQFATQAGIQSMQTIVDLVPLSPPAAKTWDIVAAAESVAQGVTAMEIQWPGILGSLTDPKAPVYGKMAYAPPPGRGPLGGWGGAISAYSKHKEASWLLLSYLTSPRIQKEYAPKGYAITAQALFNDPDIQKIYPYASAAGQAMANGYPWPRTPETNDVFTIMVKHINAAIAGEEAPADAAKAMNDEVLKLRQDRGMIKS